MLLAGKKVLITGSRRGIGRGIATMLAAEGADVGINDVVRDDLTEETLRLVEDHNRTASWHLADVSDRAQVERMFDEFLDVHGAIDVLVNNAIASQSTPFLEITDDDWDAQVGLGLKGYFMCAQRAAREMVRQGHGGSIISISSVHGPQAWTGDLIYGVCKMGLIRMAKSMALELSGHGVRCTCVAPGYIDSRVLPPEQEHTRGGPGYADHAMEYIPARRGGVPADIAGAVLFLSSDLGSYVNGECITVDGGLLAASPTEVEHRRSDR